MDDPEALHQPKKILVVDDSEDMRSLLGQLLEEDGYQLIFADDGLAAVNKAEASGPDLILMDMSLPIMNGWEAVERLRKQVRFRKTPIIALTAHVSKVEEERARAVGCDMHIGKPFDVVEVLEQIKRLLGET